MPTLDDFVGCRSRRPAAARAVPRPARVTLPPEGDPLHRPVLRELVRIDLEFGWEAGRAPRRWTTTARLPRAVRRPGEPAGGRLRGVPPAPRRPASRPRPRSTPAATASAPATGLAPPLASIPLEHRHGGPVPPPYRGLLPTAARLADLVGPAGHGRGPPLSDRPATRAEPAGQTPGGLVPAGRRGVRGFHLVDRAGPRGVRPRLPGPPGGPGGPAGGA